MQMACCFKAFKSLHLHSRIVKVVDILEQPNAYKYLVFPGIHHLTVRDLDEIVSLGKSRNLKLINLKSHAPFIIKLHSENLLEVFSPFIHHKYTEITYLSFEKRRTRPNSQGSFLLSSLYLFSNCILHIVCTVSVLIKSTCSRFFALQMNLHVMNRFYRPIRDSRA